MQLLLYNLGLVKKLCAENNAITPIQATGQFPGVLKN